MAQASGQGRLVDIIDAAVRNGGDDPNVLVGAYILVLEEDLKARVSDANAWFRRALDRSGPDGPVKQFQLKDLLQQLTDWSSFSKGVSDAVLRGDMPLFVAASGLRTTLVDLLLGDLVRNASQGDSRKCLPVTTFSGRRDASTIGDVQRLALDITSVMVLGWLGLLPRVLNSFPEIVLPASTLYELFNGQGRLRRFQKSRLKRAEQIREFVARGQLKVLRAPVSPGDPLSNEIGLELAALIQAAQTNNGIVLRPAPIYKVGLEEFRDATTTGYQYVLTGMHQVLDLLHECGAVDEVTEHTAKDYFDLQDRGWPDPASLHVNKALYIDSVALNYLQTVNLLAPVVRLFSEVYIDWSEESAAFAVIEYNEHVVEILRIIDDIRNELHRSYLSGRIIFGAHRDGPTDEKFNFGNPPSLNLLSDLLRSDAVAFDDRAINKEFFVADLKGHRAKVVTTLDLVEELRARNLISEAERRTTRHRLRIGGACLVPADANEVKLAAARSGINESIELRALGESLFLPRTREIPQFPTEVPWFHSISSAIRTSFVEIWKEELDANKAGAIADAVRALYPAAEDWVACWHGQAPPEWITAVNRIFMASLALPFELTGEARAASNYLDWLEQTVFEPLRRSRPETYQGIVDFLKRYIISLRNELGRNGA